MTDSVDKNRGPVYTKKVNARIHPSVDDVYPRKRRLYESVSSNLVGPKKRLKPVNPLIHIDLSDPQHRPFTLEVSRILYELFSAKSTSGYFLSNTPYVISDGEQVVTLSHSICERPTRKIGNGVRFQVITDKLGKGGFGQVFLTPYSFKLDSSTSSVSVKFKERVAKFQSFMDGDLHSLRRLEYEARITMEVLERVTWRSYRSCEEAKECFSLKSYSPLFCDTTSIVTKKGANNFHCIFMPRIRGKALTEYLRDGLRLDYSQSVFIACEVTRQLSSLHRNHGLAHLDVKPGNIIFDPETECAQLIDYGLCASFDSVIMGSAGTNGYIAPEVTSSVGEVEVKPSMDVYSLGCTFVDMFRGQEPSKTLIECIIKMVSFRSKERPNLKAVLAALEAESIYLNSSPEESQDSCYTRPFYMSDSRSPSKERTFEGSLNDATCGSNFDSLHARFFARGVVSNDSTRRSDGGKFRSQYFGGDNGQPDSTQFLLEWSDSDDSPVYNV